MLDLSQSPASPQVFRNAGLVGWSQLDAVLGNESVYHLPGDGSVLSPKTRSWRSVRGKQHQQVKLISASPLKSSPTPNIEDSVLAGKLISNYTTHKLNSSY